MQRGFSFGVYDREQLVGLLIAEPQAWNQSLSVWEFHVAPAHRRAGIGRQLMATAEADRFAREIVDFLRALPSALAAPECQTGGRLSVPDTLSIRFVCSPLRNLFLFHL
jgi:GNAT superfamily N-acetyltransferase